MSAGSLRSTRLLTVLAALLLINHGNRNHFTAVLGLQGAYTVYETTGAKAADIPYSAEGDLDGDSTFSTFELATSTDADNSLYHARGFYIMNEVAQVYFTRYVELLGRLQGIVRYH